MTFIQFDYYPFGSLMPGRKYTSGNGYRYGFNGKENDNDVKGEGNQQDYGMRIYDPRLGKFLSLDPLSKKYPWYTPYSFAGNKPIWAVDLDGEEEAYRGQIGYLHKQDEMSQAKAGFDAPKLSAYNPSNSKWTSRWQHSNNFFSKLSYNIVNGIYTTGQQLSSSLTGQEQIQNIGGGSYDSHGAFGEKQRMEHFVDAATAFTPNAALENKGVGFFSKALNSFKKGIVETTEKEITETIAQQASKRIGSTGKIGEDYLKTLGGQSQKYFETTVGKGGRFVDQFVNGTAFESKVGYTTLTKDIQMQIAKDVELLANNPDVKKVVWTFFESPVTGKAGASKPLQEALKNAGIETKIIRK